MYYAYDAVGNVLTIKDYKAGGIQTQSFTYDALDRLLTAVASGGSGGTYSQKSYNYSAIGNITSFEGMAYCYQDAAHKHAVTHLGGTSSSYRKYWYDANGNQTKRKVGSFSSNYLTYDEENRLEEVEKDSSVVATFTYDGDGNLVKKEESNGTTTLYVGGYYEETSTGTITRYYYAAGQRVAMRKLDNEGGDELYYLHTDHLGSTSLVTYGQPPLVLMPQMYLPLIMREYEPGGGAQGAGPFNSPLELPPAQGTGPVAPYQPGDVVARQWYYPYGEVRHTEGTTLPTDLTFTGQRDVGMGLMHYGARFYDSYINRWIQPDTIIPDFANPQSLNRFSYVLGNPLKCRDPSGHIACLDEECNWVENPVTGKIVPGPAVDPLEAWRTEVLVNLLNAGTTCQHAAQYIMDNDVQIDFAKPLIGDVGAWWTFRGDIKLHSDYYSLQTSPASPQLLGTVVHEAKRLEQGPNLALSVEGEVGGWTTEYDARIELDRAGFGRPIQNTHWRNVARTPASPTDQDLLGARSEMIKMTGLGYFIWILPLRPTPYHGGGGGGGGSGGWSQGWGTR